MTSVPEEAVVDLLRPLLVAARDLGFVGPGPVEPQILHSLRFRHAVGAQPTMAVDLGSGAGLPGLALGILWPRSQWTLLDANARRTAWLSEALRSESLASLQLGSRIQVLCQRAEDAGRGPLRSQADLVVARGFGRPAVTAECAAPLLATGGSLVVSEPPGGQPARWPATALSQLGLVPTASISEPIALQVMTLTRRCPDHYPRPVGKPSKRPLF